jgi:tetratricopeptide (TPR) repeat protein
MKKHYKRIAFRIVFFSFAVAMFGVSVLAANTIIGVVYDNRNSPLVDVDVELQNDLGAYLQHTRTDSTGRYSYSGLADGRYSVRVTPSRYDFEEATKEGITFSTFQVTGGTGSDTQIVDFNLVPRKNGLAYAEARVVFVQEIPDSAKKSFSKGETAMKKKMFDEAIINFEEAIKIFPNYFSALSQLGEIYIGKKDYGKAANLLIRAADINNKSPRTFYLLGYTLTAMKLYPAAIISLGQSLLLTSESSEVLLMLGTLEMFEGKYIESEKHLKQVKKLSTTPNPDVFWQLSQLYGKYLKRYSDAAGELEAFIKSLPDAVSLEQKKKIEDYKKIVKQLKDKAATTPKT